jgi:FkbM family methyltransferase
LLRRTLIRVSGNRFVQRLLEKNVEASQYLMGIGSGGDVQSSGEATIFRILRRAGVGPHCIFDVGANKGQFLRIALDNLRGVDCSIHCFEPAQQAWQELREFAKTDARVRVNHVGVGKENGRALLHFDRPGSGLASLTRRRLDHHGIPFDGSESIEILTIDDYCSRNAIEHIHLLKLDIEGHELDALAGASAIFERRAVDLVMFEFGGCNIDTRTFFQDCWYFFARHRMSIFRVTPSGYLFPIESYREIEEQFRTINFVAVAEGIES